MSHDLESQQLSHYFDFDNALDTENPRSLVNILPGAIANLVKAIPEELLTLDPDVLAKAGPVAKIKDKLDMIRIAWWLEYNRAQKTQTNMNISNICAGLVYRKTFTVDYLGNSYRLLYIMTPPVDYQVQSHMILNVSMKQELEILSLDHMKAVYNKEGVEIGQEVDAKLLAVKQKIAESMRNRLMGMPISRSMQINRNFNENISSSGGPNLSNMDVNELENYVNELKEKSGIAETKIKDVHAKQES